jgi:hypothetical protein
LDADRAPQLKAGVRGLLGLQRSAEMKSILILLILCTGIVAQSREDLKKKYGEPVSESFLLRPSITVTASYNSTGQITELVIAPFTTDLIKSKGDGLSHDTVKQLIDELVPQPARGISQIGGFLNIACLPANDCYGSEDNYQNLTVYYNAGKTGNVNYVVIQWKK